MYLPKAELSECGCENSKVGILGENREFLHCRVRTNQSDSRCRMSGFAANAVD